MEDVIGEIKKKREFSGLPDSIVRRAAEIVKGTPNGHDSGDPDVKESRALLRKYFGVFLTNRVLKGKGDLLAAHISSKKRNYKGFYDEVFSDIGEVGSIIDLGSGVNGYSYPYLKKELGGVNYVAVEAAGQLVENMNNYFEEEGFSAKAICEDLFKIETVMKIIKEQKKPRVVFMFQVVDALENLEKNFSKKFILEISKECEWIVLSLSTESLSGRKRFEVQRKWIIDFLKENFMIVRNFESKGELIIILKNKK